MSGDQQRRVEPEQRQQMREITERFDLVDSDHDAGMQGSLDALEWRPEEESARAIGKLRLEQVLDRRRLAAPATAVKEHAPASRKVAFSQTEEIVEVCHAVRKSSQGKHSTGPISS